MRKEAPRNRFMAPKELDAVLADTIPAVEAAIAALQGAITKTTTEAQKVTGVEGRVREAVQQAQIERRQKVDEIAKVMYLFGAADLQPVFDVDGTTEIGKKWVIEFPATEGNGQGLPRFEASLAAAMAVD